MAMIIQIMIAIVLPVSVRKAFLRRGGHEQILTSKTPNQGLQSSFCCRIAGQRLTEEEMDFSQTPALRIFISTSKCYEKHHLFASLAVRYNTSGKLFGAVCLRAEQ